jgi:hypothetical protein
MGFDLMSDPALLAAAKADLAARTAGKPFVSLLPEDRTGPIGIPDWLIKTGRDDFVPFDPAG